VENTACSAQGFKAMARLFDWAGMFKTNRFGNLEHIESGEENYKKYEIQH